MAKEHHILDTTDIEDRDEINDGEQLVWVWCQIHKRYEWHNISLHAIEHGFLLDYDTKPVEF